MRCLLPAIAAVALFASASASADTDSSGAGSATYPIMTYSILVPADSDFTRARDELQSGHFTSASRLYSRLADGSFDHHTVLLAGYASLGAGQLERAERYFERSLSLDRHNAFSRHGLGLSALAQGDRAGAAAQLDLIDRAAARCGGECSRAGEIERAAASLRRAIG